MFADVMFAGSVLPGVNSGANIDVRPCAPVFGAKRQRPEFVIARTSMIDFVPATYRHKLFIWNTLCANIECGCVSLGAARAM
jgi:hypothetical protein